MYNSKTLNYILNKIDVKKANLIRTTQINNLSLSFIFKNFIRVFFFKVRFRYFIKKNTNSIFISTHSSRSEILKSFKEFSNRFENKGNLKILNYTFEIKDFFLQIKIFFIIYKKIKIKIKKKKFLNQIFLSLSYLEIYNLYLRLYKILFYKKELKHFIFMMEMQYYENLICQFANINKKKTYAFQHAFYRYSGKKISHDNVNPINYLAAVSKFAFVWGLKHQEIIKKYTYQQPIIVGKKIELVKKFSEDIILLLESVKKKKLNLKMIEILKQTKLKFKIKKHPDDTNNYAIIEYKNDNKYMPKTVFANDTTELFKYALNNCQMYIYKESYFLRKNDKFFIGSKIKDFKIIKNKKRNKFWKNYINSDINGRKIILK